jgi:hypothetical protein
MPIEPTPLRDPSAVEGAAGRTLFVRSSVPIPPHAGRACTPPPAALTAVCCAQLGTVLLTLPLRDRLLTARVTPDERANRPTTTTQSCGRSRRRAGTPRVREGGPPCRRRSPNAPPPRSLALPHPRRHLRRSQRHRRPIPKLTPSPPATSRHRRHIAAERGLPLTVTPSPWTISPTRR